ncbi:hypothetical protein Tco_0202459, partial [Tanacetum coccineum]
MTVVVTTTIADVYVVPIPNVKAGASVAITSKLNELATSSDSFYASQDLDSKTLHNIYVSKWKVTNDFILDDPCVLGRKERHAAKSNELWNLKERNFALEGEKDVLSEKVTTLESV